MIARRIAITGASRGLGLALSKRLTELGHSVFGGARSSLLDFPGIYEELDVRSSNSQTDWWNAAEKAWEGHLPDILVANAAVINESLPLWEVPPEDFREVMDANITGVFLSFRELINRWLASSQKEPCTLVALSSGWGRSTSPAVAPYCASKWAIEGMVKALAQELPDGLSVVALNPGIIDTQMLQSCFGKAASHHEKPEQWALRAAEQILRYGPSDNGASLSIS